MRKWLRELRLKKGLTQVQCSAELNIPQGYYCEIEAGIKMKNGLPLPFANKLCKLFDVTLDYIQSCEEQILNEEEL